MDGWNVGTAVLNVVDKTDRMKIRNCPVNLVT